MEGTEDAFQPFWSADSQSVAFVTRGKLRRVQASGGAPEEICNAPEFYGGAWNREGRIIFGSASGLFIVPAEGGTPKPMTTLGEGESGHFWPRFLPDGRRYLYWRIPAKPRTARFTRLARLAARIKGPDEDPGR